MIRKIYLLVILLSPFYCFGQDKYFSQFDLNMMYMNPALAGFEEDNRVLIHRRNQWSGYANHFNSTIVEVNASATIRPKSIGNRGEISWAGGLYLISDYENPVFKSYEFGLIPWTMHFQLKKEFWLSLGTTIAMHHNTLDWNGLLFSDQINDYNNETSATSAQLPLFKEKNILFDPSFGFILTKHHGSDKSNQRTVIGMAFHHLGEPISSFYNAQEDMERLDFKYTIHGEYIKDFNERESKLFKSWKLVYKHEMQGSNIIQRDELGSTTVFGNGALLESGFFWRIARHNIGDNAQLMLQSFSPLLRCSFGFGSIGVEMSYSYDWVIGKLEHTNARSTHEFSLNFVFVNTGRRVCPANNQWGNNKKWNNVILQRGKYKRFKGGPIW